MSIGLFAFSGGFTNWIAIQMLFYKIPLIYGQYVSVFFLLKIVSKYSNST